MRCIQGGGVMWTKDRSLNLIEWKKSRSKSNALHVLCMMIVCMCLFGNGRAQMEQPLKANRRSKLPAFTTEPMEVLGTWVEYYDQETGEYVKLDSVEIHRVGPYQVEEDGVTPADPNGPFKTIPIYVSSFVERLFNVDVDRYVHDVAIRLMLSWSDHTFAALRENATNRYLEGGDECEKFCEASSIWCCDTVWVPGALLINVDELVEGRTQNEMFYELVDRLDPNKTAGARDYSYTNTFGNNGPGNDGVVLWAMELHGIYHSDFVFEDFPNDKQVLKISFRAEDCGYEFVPSASGKAFSWAGNRAALRGGSAGDDTSGWNIDSVQVVPWYAPYTNLYTQGTKNDPKDPFFGSVGFMERATEMTPDEIDKQYDECAVSYPATCGNGCIHGFTVEITLKRYASYYGWNTIFPVAVIVIASLLTYFLDPKMIELRLSSVIALILALTALQFVIGEFVPNSSYLTPIAEMIVAGYWIMLVEAIETVFVYWLVEYKTTLKERLEEQREMASEPQNHLQQGVNNDDSRRAFSKIEMAMKGKSGSSKVLRQSTFSTPGCAPATNSNVDRDDLYHDVENDSVPEIVQENVHPLETKRKVDPLDGLNHRIPEQNKSSSGVLSFIKRRHPQPKELGSESSSPRSLTPNRSASSGILRVLQEVSKSRIEYNRQKSEYQLALTIDLVFLIISAITFLITSLVFFLT